MKKLKGLVCLALSAVMVFTLAACGSTFDGNYKEVTGEEYNTVVDEVKTAFAKNGIDDILNPKTEKSKNIRLANANAATAKGAKAEIKVNLGYKSLGSDAKEIKYDTTSSEEVCVNDGKLEIAAKSELKIKSNLAKSIDSTLKAEAYVKDGNMYLGLKTENKGEKASDPLDAKIKVSTALSVIDVDDIINFYTITECAENIVMQSAEQLNKAGVKVYMDKTDDAVKVKYVVDLNAYDELGIGTSKASYDLKDCYVIVVLDNEKGLSGVKVKLDVTAKRDMETIVTKIEGYVEKTDKGVKFPKLDKYEEADIKNVTDIATGLEEFFLSLGQSVGEIFD